jgi:hypothetical protein
MEFLVMASTLRVETSPGKPPEAAKGGEGVL